MPDIRMATFVRGLPRPRRRSRSFEDADEGTVIRLREHGYPDTPEGISGLMDCATGLGEALTLLKFYVEHGVRY